MKVLYISGWTRSGSTLLDTLLGEIDGFFSAGELISLWRMGMTKKRLCGCGQRLETCPVWRPVVERVYGEPQTWESRAAPIIAIRDSVIRLRNLPKLLRAADDPNGWAPLDAYSDALSQIYASLGEQTGARVVVDSSKLPHQAAAEMSVKGIDLYLVHLVRDPRAVAFSMLRKTMLQDDPDDPVEMPRAGVLYSTAGWVRANLGTEAVARRLPAGHSMRVRYEDLASDPRRVIDSIAKMVGESGAGLTIDDGLAQLSGNHTVWGNSFRFKKGPLRIRLDEEWRSAMPASQRAVATAVAAPWLRRYGYALR